MHNYTQI